MPSFIKMHNVNVSRARKILVHVRLHFRTPKNKVRFIEITEGSRIEGFEITGRDVQGKWKRGAGANDKAGDGILEIDAEIAQDKLQALVDSGKKL